MIMYILDRTDKRRLAFETRFTFLGAHISSRVYPRVALPVTSALHGAHDSQPVPINPQIEICLYRAPSLIRCVQEPSQRDFASSVQYGHSSRRCLLLRFVHSFKRNQKNVTNCSYCMHGTQERVV